MIIEETEINFMSMGLFNTHQLWIHPKRCETTFEIIYVTEGIVNISEEDNKYILKKGDLIVLDKGKQHFGFKHSDGKTSFYWLHITDIPKNFPKTLKNFKSGYLFKELIHYSNLPSSSKFAVEAVCAHILAEISTHSCIGSSLANKIYEWVRINADAKLTVQKTADYFNYNSEYISRLMKKEYGVSMKTIINNFILIKAKNLLLNTDYYSKQISAILGFNDTTAFINYFKYHEGLTPTTYRNKYVKLHMNNK